MALEVPSRRLPPGARTLLGRAGIALLVTLAACAHGRIIPETARIPTPVGRVDVQPAPELPGDRIARWRELDADRVIREAIESELASAGAWQPGAGVEVVVTVTIFRLRSSWNAAINGLFAGIDMLEGSIEIRRPDAEPERLTFKFSGAEDEYLKFSSGARFRSLVRALAREIRAHAAPS